jgi:hypothetical protein
MRATLRDWGDRFDPGGYGSSFRAGGWARFLGKEREDNPYKLRRLLEGWFLGYDRMEAYLGEGGLILCECGKVWDGRMGGAKGCTLREWGDRNSQATWKGEDTAFRAGARAALEGQDECRYTRDDFVAQWIEGRAAMESFLSKGGKILCQQCRQPRTEFEETRNERPRRCQTRRSA